MAHELQKTVDGSGCEHVEHPASPAKDSTDNSMNDGPPLPEGYFYSKEFLGSVSAACLGLLAGIAGFSFPAPVLAQINADIGPSNNITWASIVYTLCIAVGLTVVGRLGDVFGRRYVFIVGGLLAVIGSVVAATAQSVNILIAGMTFIGLGASTQVSYFYVIAELVPSQYRFLGNSVGYIFAIPGGAVSPALAHACILHTRPGWRALFYIILGFNSAALICWILFYHPPDFQMKHGDSRRRDYMRNFDYIGTVLLVSGLLLFLLGLQWGGSVYSWDSASVIATIVIGACTLIAFVLWECFGKLKEPLVPMRALRDVGFAAAVVTSGIGASLYYALSIVWPQMVAQVYTSDDFMEIGWEASIVGACWVLGEITSGVLAKYIGKIKQQCTLTLGVATIFLGCKFTL
jgi:MFS family permease